MQVRIISEIIDGHAYVLFLLQNRFLAFVLPNLNRSG